ncbi:hypothetical protein ABZ905_32200 [Streptomyces parvus]|uniref:hypothetical protein n=1 Tax=Streptomyces parvus TaxID=66428 RepID=UPI0033C70E4C
MPVEVLDAPLRFTRAAYAVDVLTRDKIPGNPVPVFSPALLNAVLVDVLRHRPGVPGGMVALDDHTGEVTYTYGALSSVFHATPVGPPGDPECVACGQWEREHRDASNASSCGNFRLFPRTGSPENLLCSVCLRPFLGHGGRFTGACDDFRPLDLRGKPITPYLTPRYIGLREDGWVLVNVELPEGDMDAGTAVMARAKEANWHMNHRTTWMCIPAGYRRGVNWLGEAAFYGTEGYRS